MPRLRVAYLDTETTGLSARTDRIVEIAVVLAEVEWATGAIVQRLDEYQGLQDPGRRIPREAIAVHGITDSMVRGQRIESRRVLRLLGAADICMAHNSGFDRGFVAQVLPQAGAYLWGCTCRGIPWKKLYPGLSSTSIQALAAYFGTQKGEAHRALGDVESQMNLVSQPGIQGGLAFQHYLLHMNLRRPGLAPRVVLAPDQSYKRMVVGLRASSFNPTNTGPAWLQSPPVVQPEPSLLQGFRQAMDSTESLAHLLSDPYIPRR